MADPLDEEPIFCLAWECDDHLQECLGNARRNGSTIKERLEDFQRRFDACCEYLGVFAGKKSNLDRRLRNYPVRDSMASDNKNGTSIPTFQYSATQSEDTEMTDSSDPITVGLEGIDESLTELSRLAIAIRQSPKVTETTRARNFANANADLAPFEIIAFLAVEALYPNAPESLQLQLSKSMVDRYALLLYRAPRQRRLGNDTRRQVMRQNDAESNIQPEVENHYSADVESAAEHTSNHLQAQTLLQLAAEPTSVDQSRFRRNLSYLNNLVPKSQSGTTTAVLGRTHEPPVPVSTDEYVTQCQWCYRSIDQSLVQNGRWTRLGREHYLADLTPFTCISEERATWKCKLKHPSPAYFSSRRHLHGHIKAVHPNDYARKGATAVNESVENSKLDDPREPNICPLCHFTPKGLESAGPVNPVPSGKKHPNTSERDQSPLEEASSKRFKTGIPPHEQTRLKFANADIPNDEMGEMKIRKLTHQRTPLFLMVLSLKLINTRMKTDDERSDVGSSRSPSRIEASSENQDFEDLPSLPDASPTHSDVSRDPDDGHVADWTIVTDGHGKNEVDDVSTLKQFTDWSIVTDRHGKNEVDDDSTLTRFASKYYGRLEPTKLVQTCIVQKNKKLYSNGSTVPNWKGLLDWISPIDYSTQQKEFIKKTSIGTGE
ncbi:hypothetical protein AJ79_05613 [Helicocarpus griseus UAMH5409]|uniref:Uncharacterized protein n=1 Tax=Helicocarpus griseus UAMH5409 TaxID=1447875 RepID=A0A2B7XM24_9EURO|nr:hypothetical protein AJ79_05613 [Helicocarpus griseus UAMH5409]